MSPDKLRVIRKSVWIWDSGGFGVTSPFWRLVEVCWPLFAAACLGLMESEMETPPGKEKDV